MKIQYLGTAAAEGVPGIFCECESCKRTKQLGGKNIRTRSQALIDGKILIDFPADTYMHYLKWNIPLDKIKTCIITHSHSDHLYPIEIEMRINGYAHISSGEPLTFYSAESGYEMLKSVVKRYNISENDIVLKLVKPFEPFETEGYGIMPIKATHDEKSTPVIYAIEKDGKSLLYANDTSELCDESMECLRKVQKPFDVISLDCTQANDPIVPYVGHLNLNKCIALRNEFKKDGIADENTKFVLNHFSHNGSDVVYDDFVKIAGEKGFITAYDGMILEF